MEWPDCDDCDHCFGCCDCEIEDPENIAAEYEEE